MCAHSLSASCNYMIHPFHSIPIVKNYFFLCFDAVVQEVRKGAVKQKRGTFSLKAEL